MTEPRRSKARAIAIAKAHSGNELLIRMFVVSFTLAALVAAFLVTL